MIKKGLLVVLIVVALFSCVRKKTEDRTLRIGFSAASDVFLHERWRRDIKIFMNAARELGAEVLLAKSPGNALGQIPQIQYLLDQEIDVLVVIPQDKELLGGVVKVIHDRGIPVLSYDRPIMGVAIAGYVSFDNREVGRLQIRALVSRIPQGNYLIVNGSVRDNNSFEINRGIHEVLDPLVEDGEITIEEELWLEHWSFDEALEKVEMVLNRGEKIDAIAAGNDQLAAAAIRVLAERRLAGEVAVVGQDADLVACQRIMEGTQLMTVYKPIHLLATRAAKLAVQMAKGETPLPDQFIDNGSGTDIPYFVETPLAVFKEQMDQTVIRDGFHSREDVYRSEQP